MPLACRRLLCVFPAVVSLALFAPTLRADVLSSPQGYTVTIPHGWQTTHETRPNLDGPATDMMYTHPPDAFPLFRVEVDPQRRATMQNAEAMQAAFIQNKMLGFRILKQRLRRVSGSPASETAAIGPFQGQLVILDMIYTLHHGRIYTITFMTTPKTDRMDMPLFTHILSTLHLAGTQSTHQGPTPSPTVRRSRLAYP